MNQVIRFCLALSLLTITTVQVRATTFGEIDTGDQFPNVGAIVIARPGREPILICSGTLIHPRLFLTAGHCTRALNQAFAAGQLAPEHVRIGFGTNALHDTALWQEIDYAVTDPLFGVANDSDVHDQGLVILKQPVLDRPCAVLADLGFLGGLDAAGLLRENGIASRFVPVGYGFTLDFPPPEQIPIDGWRRFVSSQFQCLHNAYLIVNQNHAATGGGGIATNDSGGPMFWIADDGTPVLVAISFFADPQRVAVGWGYRVDLPEGRQFIDFFLALAENGLL
jgi:hypothetical protein